MQLISHQHLKPLDLSRSPHAAHAGGANTHLSPSDFGGAHTHTQTHTHPQHGKAKGAAESADPKVRHDQLIEQTKKWVAQTFFGTLMKQMHESPFKSKMFEGGRGGEAFGQMFDQHLVDHMSRGAGNKLVNAIVRKIEARDAAAAKSANAAYSRQGANKPPAQAPAASAAGNPVNSYKNVRVHVETGR